MKIGLGWFLYNDGEHGWNRTNDNLIKSEVLYRLSYVLFKVKKIKKRINIENLNKINSKLNFKK